MFRVSCMPIICGFCVLFLASCGRVEEQVADHKSEYSVAQGNNEFAMDLYRQLAKQAKDGENIFFSPYSISSALAMTYAGARGRTAADMSKVLRFDKDQDRFHLVFAEHARCIRKPRQFEGEINVANALWVDQSVRLQDPFTALMQEHYNAGLRTVDFGKAQQARREINGWVSEQTKKHIEEVVPENSVSSATTLVLVNALYFQAGWLHPFDDKATKQGLFHRPDKDPSEVPMMRLRARLLYAKVENAEVVQLPYAGEQFVMLLAVPARGKAGEFERDLRKWGDWVKELQEANVTLTMPRVCLRTNAALKKPLRAMGLIAPFANPDFSAIGRVGRIDEVYHTARLDLDERGTTASAATAVLFLKSAVPAVTLEVDRTFFFMILEATSNTILFQGRMSDPRGV